MAKNRLIVLFLKRIFPVKELRSKIYYGWYITSDRNIGCVLINFGKFFPKRNDFKIWIERCSMNKLFGERSFGSIRNVFQTNTLTNYR